MKIVIIANGYPDKKEPQWGCFERDQALALSEQGHQVSVLYVDKRFRTYWRRIGFSHLKEKEVDAYGIFIMPTRWIRRLLGSRIHYWVSTRLLEQVYRRYVREHGCPDIIYAHYLYNIAYAVFLKKKYSVPIVGIEHWSVLNQKTLSPNQMSLGRIGYNHADKLLAVSESLKTQIKSHFAIDSTVVYDMLGPEFISPSVKQKTIDKGFKFIAVGSLIKRKGYDVLISAFAKSNLAQRRCQVVIVGDGEEKSNLANQIHELGLTESVLLAGRKSKIGIINLMSECHAFVLSSRAETFGVVCIEAMSQGLPTIATICGGPEELISEKNGILIPTDDIDAMAEALCQMYENYGKYDNVMIADDCISRFSPKVIANQLTLIFNNIVKK